WRRPGARRLESGKGEYLVFLDRSADGSAELVTAECVLRGGEIIARIEGSVANKFEQASVDLVAAGFGDGVDHRPRMKSIAGGNAAGLNAELLQGIRERERQVHVGMRVVMVAAVEQIVIAVDLASSDRYAHRGRVIVGRDHPARRVGWNRSAAGEQDQVGGLPAIERQVDNAALVDYLRNRRVLHFHHRRVG